MIQKLLGSRSLGFVGSGSCRDDVCGAGTWIKIFTHTGAQKSLEVWPDPVNISLHLEILGCSMLIESLKGGWTSVREATWQSSEGSAGKEPEGYNVWSRHGTRGHKTETGGASSCTATYKTQTEANDNMKRKTEKALDTVAILSARFEKGQQRPWRS